MIAPLAVLREIGPVLGDPSVVVDPAARVGDGDRHRRQTLGRRVDDDQRVLVPRLVAVGCAAATPEVDHLLATPVRGDGGADLAALDEVAVELLTHFLEARSDATAAVRRALDGFQMQVGVFARSLLLTGLTREPQGLVASRYVGGDARRFRASGLRSSRGRGCR